MTKKTEKPKELRPWDRRPWPQAGDSDLQTIYASVGRTLSQWERYEAVLSLLFSAFVAGTETQAARRAYAAVRTFEGRAEMLRAASSAYFEERPDEDIQNMFKEVLRDATSFSPRRNDIAHGVVDYFLPESWVLIDNFAESIRDLPEKPEQFALYPSYASFRERSLDNVPTYCYASPEVDYFYGIFLRLVTDASRTCGHLLKVRKRPSLQRHYAPVPPSTNPPPDQNTPK